jgi:hypothetical protein
MKKKNLISTQSIIFSISILILLSFGLSLILKDISSKKVKFITFDNEIIVIEVMGKISNTYTSNPKDLDPFNFKWSSSNVKIATVTEFGIIDGLSVGEATITARSQNNTYDTFIIKVVDHY